MKRLLRSYMEFSPLSLPGLMIVFAFPIVFLFETGRNPFLGIPISIASVVVVLGAFYYSPSYDRKAGSKK